MKLHVITAHEDGTDARDVIVCVSTVSADDAMQKFLGEQREFWEGEAEALGEDHPEWQDMLDTAALYADVETFRAKQGDQWTIEFHEDEV